MTAFNYLNSSELDRLREALDGVPMDSTERYKIVWAAARRFLALTETGRRVNWCETHEETTKSDSFCAQGAVYRRKFECSIVPKLLADYLTEEDS